MKRNSKNPRRKKMIEHIIFETEELNKEKLIKLYSIAKKAEREFNKE